MWLGMLESWKRIVVLLSWFLKRSEESASGTGDRDFTDVHGFLAVSITIDAIN